DVNLRDVLLAEPGVDITRVDDVPEVGPVAGRSLDVHLDRPRRPVAVVGVVEASSQAADTGEEVEQPQRAGHASPGGGARSAATDNVAHRSARIRDKNPSPGRSVVPMRTARSSV